MLPFDLQKALAGEPVVTRSGLAVTQLTLFTIEDTGFWETNLLAGVIAGRTLFTFGHDGAFLTQGGEHDYDLFMAPPTRIINGFEVPAPESKEPENGTFCYLADPFTINFFSTFTYGPDSRDLQWLDRGLVFLNKADAIANAKAMIGINPTQE